MKFPEHLKKKKKKLQFGHVFGGKWTKLKDSFHYEHFHGPVCSNFIEIHSQNRKEVFGK